MAQLNAGDRVKTRLGDEIAIVRLLGDGGQGEVYLVEYLGKQYALKWYSPETLGLSYFKKFLSNLEKNISRGSPGPVFLWPQALALDGKGGYGYVMDLFPKDYVELTYFLTGKEGGVEFDSFGALLNAALNITAAFQSLHVGSGLCYQDLNAGNFVIHPKTGDVLVADNDNAAPDNTPLVRGKPYYMAPEVVREEKLPSSVTDFFSLAIVLFWLFYRGTPFEGKYTLDHYPCIGNKEARIIYGEDPRFVFDPNDSSNRPDENSNPNVADRSGWYPPELKEMFCKALVVGAKTPAARPPESEWIDCLIGARDKLVLKQNGREQFVNFDQPGTIPPGCRRLDILDHAVALYPRKALCQCHVKKGSRDYKTVVGGVIVAPNNNRMLALKNVSKSAWQVQYPGRPMASVNPGQSFALVPGAKAYFGGAEGVIS